MRCTFCLLDKPSQLFSLEHIFPESLGGRVTTGDVCKECNDRLGHSVDTTLTQHKLIKLARMTLGLAGKTGQIPNPIERGTLREDQDHKLVYKVDPAAGPSQLYTVPRVNRTVSDDGSEEINIVLDTTDAHKLGEIVNKARFRRKQPPLTPDEIAALPIKRERIDQPWMHIEFNIDVNQYRRGVMKIVYELACRWLGATYPDDPATKAIRDFIWDKALPLDPSTKYPIRGGIQLMGNEFLMPLWTTERDHLLAASITQGRTIGVYVRVLGVFEALVQVTDDVSRYPGYTDQFVCTDPRTGATRETSFLEEVERLCNGVAG